MTRHVLMMAALVSACASTSPAGPRGELADELSARTGLDDVVVDRNDAEALQDVQRRVEELLSKPLTVEAATRIAALNNRGLAATFEGLGVAQADLVQAGLLQNPTLGGDVVISTRGNGLGGGLGLSQSLLSAFLIPAKKRLASTQLQRAIVRVADETLTLLRDVKVAYAGMQAAVAQYGLQRTLVQGAEVADELAARIFEAGNLSELDRQLFASDLDHARLALADAALQQSMGREALNRELGLWGPQLGWRLATTLQDPPDEESDLARLEQLGIEQRLDLSAARFEVESMDYALQLRRRGLIPAIEVGVEARNEVGNDAGHEWVVGPSLSIEIPIFDPGHADIARLGAQLRMAQHSMQQLAVDARSQIRERRVALLTARAKSGVRTRDRVAAAHGGGGARDGALQRDVDRCL
ncbi:MAG: TolC family protein [Nannocystaceae bacterium]|nr:TolC family protein [Nannocystaceae bacterium]